jgi:hypothetical protein
MAVALELNQISKLDRSDGCSLKPANNDHLLSPSDNHAVEFSSDRHASCSLGSGHDAMPLVSDHRAENDAHGSHDDRYHDGGHDPIWQQVQGDDHVGHDHDPSQGLQTQ